MENAGYDFDEIIERKGTDCEKYDHLKIYFGREDLLPMWVADMDFRAAPEIVEAAAECCRKGVFGYTYRSDDAKQAFIDWVERRYHWKIDMSWLSSSPGVVSALAIAVRSLTQAGDKVLIQTPVYPPFHSVVQENGRTLVCSPLVVRNGHYEVDWEDFEKKLREGVKLLILCNSHNPVGRVWTRGELERIGNLCCRYDVLIFSDEIHADLALFGHRHTMTASVSDEIARRTLTAMAPSKTFNIAGMMNSIVISSSASLLQKFDRELCRLHLDLGNIFGHVTMKAAYRYGEKWLEALVAYLEKNVEFVAGYLEKELPAVRMCKPEGSFLLWLDFRGLGLSHEEVGRLLTDKAKVGLNDGLAFGKEGEGFRRMNIGCPRAVLEEGLNRIVRAFK